MSKILVLGGSGFVGRHLVARLSAAGHAVLVPTRYRERAKSLLTLPTVEVVQADIHQPDTLRRLLAGCDAVFNLVGVLHSTRARAGERYGAQFARAHVELPRQLLQSCREAGVHKLLHMSALGASIDGPSEYLRSKGAAEALLSAAADDPASSLQLRLFRPSVIYGEDDKFLNLFKDLQMFLPMLAVGGAEAREEGGVGRAADGLPIGEDPSDALHHRGLGRTSVFDHRADGRDDVGQRQDFSGGRVVLG